VFVIPSRAESQWARAFRRIPKVGFVRAGTSPLWPLDEHESLNFYWLPRYRVRPPSEDRYFWRHADDVSPLHRMAAVLGPSPVASAQARFMQELASISAVPPSDDDDVAALPPGGSALSASSTGMQPAEGLVPLEPVVSTDGHWIREDQRMPLADRARMAQCWPSPSAGGSSLVPGPRGAAVRPSVAAPSKPAPVVAPRALGVPPGFRPVTPGDHVPHLRDPRGDAYLISQDGTFWQSEGSGGRPVAFDRHGYDDLVREIEELGGTAAGLPMPVLVMADGSELA